MESNKPEATILVVDDNPTNLSVLIEHLSQSGFETLVAVDGEGAISQAALAIPDIILLDIMMPGINGFETCKRLKENIVTSHIPIIFISALSETVDKVKGFNAGGVDYITKPFQQAEVLARIRTHLTIQKQKKQLEELNATKDIFFSIISHDMRGVFTPLLGSAEIIERLISRFNDERLIKFTQNMTQSIKNALKLMENLLDWARLQKGGMTFDPKKQELAFIASNVINLLKENADKKNIELTHTIDPNIHVYADLNMTLTIIRNLTSNALKFTYPNGKVVISAKDDGPMIQISITDSGIGIDKSDIHKVFKITEKFKMEGTSGEKGTGLGLILCKDFVEKNNGTLSVESEIGKGSTFKFTLPNYSAMG